MQAPDTNSADATPLTSSTLLQETQAKIEAISATTCNATRTFLNTGAVPCLPYITKIITGEGTGASIPDSCCAGVQSDPEGFIRVIPAVVLGQADTACLCEIGDLILHTEETTIFSVFLQVNDACLDTTQGQKFPPNANRIILNSYFAPYCPKLAAALNATADSTNTGSIEELLAQFPVDGTSGANAPAPGPSPSSARSLVFPSLILCTLITAHIVWYIP